jgi:hypothetical protein
MKAIITLYTESMQEVADLTIPTHIAFAQNNGWQQDSVIVEQEGCLWAKMQLICDYLNKPYDAVFWLDVDAMVTNPEKSIDWILKENKRADVFLTSDINGLNAGIMLIRNTDRAKCFFYSCTTYGKVLFGDRPNGEQQAIRHFSLDHPYNGIVHYLDNQRELNSYYPNLYTYPQSELAHWHKGDFILHLPGTPNERRVEIFNETGKV